MASFRGLLALLGLAAGAAELQAQVIVGPNPYLGGSSLFYAHSGRRPSLAVYYGYSTPYYSHGAINQVTVVYSPQPAPQTQVAVVGVAPRILRLDDLAVLDPELRPNPAPPPEKPPPDPQLPGGRAAGVFRPLAPDNRDRAARPMPPEEKKPPPPAELPKPAPPPADPRTEAALQLKIGREAFGAREYGRATQRFRDAARRTPDNAEPYFLLGQALFAAGRYPEAVEAIRAGVGLRPDWPRVAFVPRDLYGPNAADFVDHLRRVRESLLVLPDDPVLLFLYGYELWFDGRQDEARPLFQRARIGAVDPAVIDRFLAVRPAL